MTEKTMNTLEDYKVQIKQIMDSYKVEAPEVLLTSLAAFVMNETLNARHSLFKQVVDVVEGRRHG